MWYTHPCHQEFLPLWCDPHNHGTMSFIFCKVNNTVLPFSYIASLRSLVKSHALTWSIKIDLCFFPCPIRPHDGGSWPVLSHSLPWHLYWLYTACKCLQLCLSCRGSCKILFYVQEEKSIKIISTLCTYVLWFTSMVGSHYSGTQEQSNAISQKHQKRSVCSFIAWWLHTELRATENHLFRFLWTPELIYCSPMNIHDQLSFSKSVSSISAWTHSQKFASLKWTLLLLMYYDTDCLCRPLHNTCSGMAKSHYRMDASKSPPLTWESTTACLILYSYTPALLWKFLWTPCTKNRKLKDCKMLFELSWWDTIIHVV